MLRTKYIKDALHLTASSVAVDHTVDGTIEFNDYNLREGSVLGACLYVEATMDSGNGQLIARPLFKNHGGAIVRTDNDMVATSSSGVSNGFEQFLLVPGSAASAYERLAPVLAQGMYVRYKAASATTNLSIWIHLNLLIAE